MTSATNPVENNYWVIVPAAGSGKRMGADKPKQYLPLHGKPLIAHTLENVRQWPGVKGVVVAIAADDTEFKTLPCAQDPRIQTVTGGNERADSVLAALNYLSERQPAQTPVLVHDAARPLVNTDDIQKLLAASPIALLAQPASDTVKQSRECEDKSIVQQTLPRAQIWLAQTPQKAPLGLLREVLQIGLQENPAAITDEASALELAGHSPELVAACRSNFKVTHPADLILAEALINYRASESNSGSKL
ncbi:2-C-methyl-D-erythritol 4-phosphate cytidylyltransferase [Microbulbifer elongatus]|uniref:2-C-methyl-D-erythritol 4-phosphate cytidylyltransferase n=1 Tax=Microbulbifer elongatus TaxID=86173 RepID=UPI001E42590C|nr:2-C-methyl-D-erythritol 4-phosphate cytidylyltransferase [Microbulbifer elongatus]